MPSDFLIEFHKTHFPEGNVKIYSKEVFYKLLEVNNRIGEENRIESRNNTKFSK